MDIIGLLSVKQIVENIWQCFKREETFLKQDKRYFWQKIFNFDKREYVENDTFRAWGHITYNMPLSQQQMTDYELLPAYDNSDRIQISPYQREAQVQVVGRWETSKFLSDNKRFTCYHNLSATYVKKEFVSNKRIEERFKQAIEKSC